MSNKIKLITDANELTKEGKLIINQIGKAGTVAKRIQKFLLSEIAHIEEHRNPTRLNTFLEKAKGGSVRVNAMRQFVLSFGNVAEEIEEKNGKPRMTGKLVMRKSRKAEAFEELFAKACATNWLDFKPESEVKVYDMEAFKADTIKYLSKAMAEGFTDAQISEMIGNVVGEAHASAKKVLARKAAKEASAKVMANA